MTPEIEAVLVYWPMAAYAAALIAAVFAAGWFSVSLKALEKNLVALGEARQKLNTARATSNEHKGKVKARRAEMAKVNESAAKLFWQNEKTWTG